MANIFNSLFFKALSCCKVDLIVINDEESGQERIDLGQFVEYVCTSRMSMAED